MPNELSGGMHKRAGFARALVLDPDIVLFDEPDSGLDPVRTALLGELIQEIHAEMMTERDGTERRAPAFTLITHDIMTARRVAEHISVLWKGRIVESGPAEELFESDNPFVRQFLSGESQGPLGME
jgi:phospholipid/cholesterol/gamma-HCH transport system ATP-binding protein